MPVLSDANGLPLVVGVSAANPHDSQGLKPTVAGLHTRSDPCRCRHFKAQPTHADKAYDVPHRSERSGRHRWVIERTIGR